MLPLLPYQPRSTLRKRALALLAAVNLEQRLNHYPDQLSGGEQQRVAIARALLTGSLDSTTGSQIMSLLMHLCHEQCCTLVIVTHDAGIATLADTVVQMRDGKLSPQEVKKF